jgi:hypothetical protein
MEITKGYNDKLDISVTDNDMKVFYYYGEYLKNLLGITKEATFEEIAHFGLTNFLSEGNDVMQ